jgi:hypothetical protein
LADGLNRILPERYIAEEFVSAGSSEIDVAAYEQPVAITPPAAGNGPVATLQPKLWSPPQPAATFTATFPSDFEIRVFGLRGGRTLVAAIELISPANKDRPENRRAFATKCASFLYRGISLVVVDIVTDRRANLHNETMDLMAVADETLRLPMEPPLYAVAYRPVQRNDHAEIDLWKSTFAVGDQLPTLPLRLRGDDFVPVEFETAYMDVLRRRRFT